MQRFGWAILLAFLIMFAVIGLTGIVIFLAGVLTLLGLQAALLFRYIVNENRRALKFRQ